ncbi:hypothetical protein OS189_09315 [Sulfitobacter sp. F26169L]|uniref:hypothetical protein n=1 Tax=Sulfitobacter sp. F26169L TaxID=2996015 RepID=UPI002260AF0E|nr:hypothetical protein [Sulfitobacter sp. F26169L]MCX7566537.1 hypothetical protein [Sulfitobacter sp. F26169L]
MIKKALLTFALTASPALADPATVQHVNVSKSGPAYTFSVTVLHSDKGWDDYADAWRIKDMDGNILGERDLAHPHVDEQPFTRSLSGVKIPAGVDTVVIEVRDTATGWSPNTKTIKLP